jgi:hypothetical protein
LPENGIESYAKEAQAVIDSGWIGGGNSPASFCTAQVVQRRNQHPDHIVELLKSEERSKRDLLLAVRYRYSCVLVEKWDPVYKLGPNSACPK